MCDLRTFTFSSNPKSKCNVIVLNAAQNINTCLVTVTGNSLHIPTVGTTCETYIACIILKQL